MVNHLTDLRMFLVEWLLVAQLVRMIRQRIYEMKGESKASKAIRELRLNNQPKTMK
jgi:hypothetical protein